MQALGVVRPAYGARATDNRKVKSFSVTSPRTQLHTRLKSVARKSFFHTFLRSGQTVAWRLFSGHSSRSIGGVFSPSRPPSYRIYSLGPARPRGFHTRVGHTVRRSALRRVHATTVRDDQRNRFRLLKKITNSLRRTSGVVALRSGTPILARPSRSGFIREAATSKGQKR